MPTVRCEDSWVLGKSGLLKVEDWQRTSLGWKVGKMKIRDSVQSTFHYALLLYLKHSVQRLFIGLKIHMSRHSPVKAPGNLVLSMATVEVRVSKLKELKAWTLTLLTQEGGHLLPPEPALITLLLHPPKFDFLSENTCSCSVCPGFCTGNRNDMKRAKRGRPSFRPATSSVTELSSSVNECIVGLEESEGCCFRLLFATLLGLWCLICLVSMPMDLVWLSFSTAFKFCSWAKLGGKVSWVT